MTEDWSDASISQGKAGVIQSWEKDGADSPLGLSERTTPADTLILDFKLQNCET